MRVHWRRGRPSNAPDAADTWTVENRVLRQSKGTPDQQAQDADESLKRIRAELKELLNRSPGAREVLPHLAVLEHALKSHGVDALDGLPPRVLTRATTQLLGVLSEPLSEGMTELRAWLSRALSAREEAPA